MKALALAVLLAMAPSCKKEPTTPAGGNPPITDTKPAAATGSGFTLVEMKLFIGSDMGLQVHADGRIEADSGPEGGPAKWVTIAKLTADGKLLGPEGQEAGSVQPDGSVKFGNDVAPFHFEGAAFVTKDRHVTIDDKGVVQGTDAKDVVIHVEGITDDGSRRAALFAFALAMMSAGGNGAQSEPAPATPAP